MCLTIMRHNGTGNTSGMSLLEVVIALVIVGLSIGALFSTVMQGTTHQTKAEIRTDLAVHAQSVMDMMLSKSLGASGRAEGRFSDGYEWTANQSPAGKPTAGLVPVLIQVTVQRADAPAGADALTLETIRLVQNREGRP